MRDIYTRKIVACDDNGRELGSFYVARFSDNAAEQDRNEAHQRLIAAHGPCRIHVNARLTKGEAETLLPSVALVMDRSPEAKKARHAAHYATGKPKSTNPRSSPDSVRDGVAPKGWAIAETATEGH